MPKRRTIRFIKYIVLAGLVGIILSSSDTTNSWMSLVAVAVIVVLDNFETRWII
jgi:hypothetical protein